MKKLHFRNIDAMQAYFATEEAETYINLMGNIIDAHTKNKKSIQLYEVSFDENSHVYSISLSKDQWKDSLEKALKFFTDNDYHDYAIDTWQVLQEINSQK